MSSRKLFQRVTTEPEVVATTEAVLVVTEPVVVLEPVAVDPPAPVSREAPYGGKLMPDGTAVYELAATDVVPGGILWTKTLPAGATDADYRAMRDRRAAAIERLKGQLTP